MKRPYNFSAGPATMPVEVLEQAAAEMLDWHGCGMGVMEMSHRGEAFGIILQQALDDLRELLAIPDNFRILFMQGGGLAENAIVPLNLSKGGTVDFVVTGSWSQKSFKEAGKYARQHLAGFAGIAFCFLDAEKDIYLPCYEMVIPRLAQGGFFVADNLISHVCEAMDGLDGSDRHGEHHIPGASPARGAHRRMSCGSCG